MKSKKSKTPSDPTQTRPAQEKQLKKIARQYDRLDEALSRLEAMLPDFENRESIPTPEFKRPRKPR